MPTVFLDGPYAFRFYSSDRSEPIHIHVWTDKCHAKLWLNPLTLVENNGFDANELRRIQKITFKPDMEKFRKHGRSTSMKHKFIADERVKFISFSPDHIRVDLADGRSISVPLAWYPRLLRATPAQRSQWEVLGGGFVMRWPEIDEDLEVSGLLAGNPDPGVRTPMRVAAHEISKYRERSGLSQTDLARQLGVRQATVSDWEKGKIRPSPLALGSLANLIRRSKLAALPWNIAAIPQSGETYPQSGEYSGLLAAVGEPLSKYGKRVAPKHL